MVVPTRRLLLMALAGVLPILFFGTTELAPLAGGLWLASMAILGWIDSQFTPRPNALSWERLHEGKLSLGAWNTVTLRLKNRALRPARMRVRDSLPQLLLPRGETAEGQCSPDETWSTSYSVFPVHRGDYFLGPVTARFLGPLGLAWKQRGALRDDPVKVYPNLLALRQYDALARRGHLLQMGLRRARRLGAGMEFERLRDYTPDDEYRRINWTATARRHIPITVEYQTERSQNVMLMIDAGRLMSMQVPYAGELEESDSPDEAIAHGPRDVVPALTRLDHAVNAALMLAYVSVQKGDRAGLIAFSDRVIHFVKPASGRRQFLLLTEVLYKLQPQGTEADYAEALAYLASRSPRRSLAVIFTDIAHEAAAGSLLANISHLARRHLPLVVTMRDPAVERLATVAVSDARALYERAVARNLLDQRDVVLSKLRRHGALTLDVPADALTPSVINRYLEIKARGAL